MFAPARKNIRRSRNGCAVCKSKRLKCDEARPSCSRCVRLGIPCPGYLKPLKWAAWPASPASGSKGSRYAEAGPSSDFSPQMYNTPGGSSSAPSDQALLDLPSTSFLGYIDNIIEPGSYNTPDNSLFETPFPFETLMGGAETPIERQIRTPSEPPYQELDDEESWLNTLLSVTARSHARAPFFSGYAEDGLGSRCTVSRAVPDYTSVLVEYYFKEVCGMMSCYDSPMNPYRTTISNHWSSSKALYYTTQSMAAACLSEVSRNLASAGRELQLRASQCLSQEMKEPQSEMTSLLAIVMLGMSRSWFDPGNVGQAEFEMLAQKILSSEQCQKGISLADKQTRFFFHNSLVYWQMLLAFVVDQDPSDELRGYVQPRPARYDALELRKLCMPHPQTGIGIQVQLLLADVGSLVRKERRRIHSRRFSSKSEIEEAEQAIRQAEQLHSELCAIKLPRESAIVDSGDHTTPGQHLLKVAEAYRCTGLLQLYRNFPDLLTPFLAVDAAENRELDSASSTVSLQASEVRLKSDTWLACMALHILDLIEDIPISSKSRSIQPLLLVSVCSDLGLGSRSCSFVNPATNPVESISSSERFKTPATDLDILRARRFVVSRLSSFEHILAARPIRTMLQLVKETWNQMEDAQSGVYWMDVMMDNGFETLMG